MRNLKALLLSLLLAGGVTLDAQEIDRGPYIQNLDRDSVTIMWRTTGETPSYVGIREKGAPEFKLYYSNIPTEYHELEIPHLKEDTEYEYVAGWSAEELFPDTPYSFVTFPSEDEDQFTFIVYGDHRNNPAAHRSVVEAILEQVKDEEFPRFVLDSGDLTGLGEHETDFYNEQFFNPVKGLIERSCYFPVIGNHEAHRTHPRVPLRYLKNFDLPGEESGSGTEYYYSFDFGDAHFTMLDVYATDFATGSKQWEWLRKDLKNTKKRWRFVVAHYPIFIHRSGPTVSYGNTEIREHLVPLFEEFGVTAVFSGDSHFYQRSEVNGIHYICSGGGGAPLYDPGDGMDYVRAGAKTYHYVQVKINGDEMHMLAFDPENNLLDEMKTAPRTPAPPEELPINFERRMPAENAKPAAVFIVESRTPSGDVTAAPAYREGDGMGGSTAKSSADMLSANGSRFSDNDGAGAWAEFTPPITKAGQYLISVTVPDVGSAQAPNSYFEVKHAAEIIRGRVDLSNTNAGNKWYDIGLFNLQPGDSIRFIEVEDEPGRFYSDAVKFSYFE